MRERRWSVYAASGAVAVAGVALAGRASGTEMVSFDPAEITGVVSFGAEVVTEYTVMVTPYDSLFFFPSSETFTANPYSMTVENGHDYTARVTAVFENDSADLASLSVDHTPVHVDKANGPTTIDFNYAAHRVNFGMSVAGGTLQRYHVQVLASEGGEAYRGHTDKVFSGAQPSAAQGWAVMAASDAVDVYGYLTSTAPDGTQIQRTFENKGVDLSQGDADLAWSFDLNGVGTLYGDIELTHDASIVKHSFEAVGTPGSAAKGFRGSKEVAANEPYSLTLPPGTYDIILRTFFENYSASSYKTYRVTVDGGVAKPLDFVETMGTGEVPLTIKGFAPSAALNWSAAWLSRVEPGASVSTSASTQIETDGRLEMPLMSGDWYFHGLNLSFTDSSNPALPLDVSYLRLYLQAQATAVDVAPGEVVEFAAQEVTLVATNAYFDLREPTPEAPEVLLSDPQVQLTRINWNPDGSPGSIELIEAKGSPDPSDASGLTLLAEPGTYTMDASAVVGGRRVQLASRPITFPTPVETGEGAEVEANPIVSQDLAVSVTFPQVTAPGGLTTVVETPFGPEPPEGLKAFCSDGASAEGVDCGGPIYYDIKTTAEYPKGEGDAPVKVCIRRKFQNGNALANFLRLWHYNEALPSADKWEELPAPPGSEPAVDCSADLAACGCADEAACGIDYLADPPVSVIMVCGMTKSFSPFAVFERAGRVSATFTNEVNGVAYEGPTGPDTLQSWAAPSDGVYRITATGARGAGASLSPSVAGGCGAQIAGDFTLHGGDTVQMLVGQKGTSAPYSGGGGGGTFVLLNGSPLIVAGGGGGVRHGALVNGRHGSVGMAGVSGSVSANYTSGFIAGGVNGLGGARASGYGSAGGGWFGNGASDGSYGEGGFSFTGAMVGRGGSGKSCGGLAHGGYGGGGAGNGCYGGGGGGGYSGGGSGRVGGGGGSWNTGANPDGHEGVCTPNGHGVVLIERVAP